MTAEIAVMNREAVALAADSAVTLGFSSGPKVFSSANKIFALSTTQPVGVMVFGGATFIDMPWETIIKEFRRQIGSEPLPTVSDYCDNFLQELLAHKAFTGPNAEQRSFAAIVFDAYNGILRDFLHVAEREIEVHNTVDLATVRRLLKEQVDHHHGEWSASDPLEGVPDEFARKVRRKYSKEVGKLRAMVFEQLPMSASTSRAIGEIAGLVFTHHAPGVAHLNYSGLVVAGFGEDEFFPHLVRQQIYGAVGGRLRVEGREELQIAHDDDAYIAPFAQREMVDAFIEGLEPGYGMQAEKVTQRLADELIEAALERAGLNDGQRTQIRKEIDGDVGKRFDNLRNELAELRFKRNVLPIVEVVAALPKDELAAMAESLVNLTSFKRRVSKSAETVGGPIDVAVISRGDGFVWIKRKHYFPVELNPRYIANLKGA